MNRIKVVSEAAELVPILRAIDSEVKREVFKEVTEHWCTEKDIENKFGEPGLEALKFFEKMNLVETKWQSSEAEPEKAYHGFYSSFHIDASSTIHEITDVLAAAVMSEEEFRKLEKKIFKFVGEDGTFVGDVAEKIKVTQTMLTGLVKRSARLEYRGHRIERIV